MIWGDDSIWDIAMQLVDDEDRKATSSPSPRQKSFGTIQQLMKTAAKLMRSEFKRIRIIRKALENDTELKSLVANVNDSRKAWRKSDDYVAHIHEISRWRKNEMKESATQGGSTSNTSPASARSPPLTTPPNKIEDEPGERQHKIAIALDKLIHQILEEVIDGKNLKRQSDLSQRLQNALKAESVLQDSNRVDEEVPEYKLMHDIKAQFLNLVHNVKRASDPEEIMGVMDAPTEQDHDAANHDDILRGRFPNQQLTLEALLKNGNETKEILLRRPIHAGPVKESDSSVAFNPDHPWPDTRECPREVRYFHIPSNNMTVRRERPLLEHL